VCASVFGGAGIVIGLWTYGYNIMRNLGNRVTLHSPSRGFSMELGSAITIIMATQLSMWLDLQLETGIDDLLILLCRSTCVYNPMYYRSYRWRRFMQWRLANYQLEDGGMDLYGLVHHSPISSNHIRQPDGLHSQCTQMGLSDDLARRSPSPTT
jgi:hypothetical protein